MTPGSASDRLTVFRIVTDLTPIVVPRVTVISVRYVDSRRVDLIYGNEKGPP